eukprot:TRINITY_DN12768_c0_g1_i1.p1 TRINITY_DN12768_c0_g1~~TRINITY_DN12768_c0_g1_i1.p1  ORF type:complete len:377 (-),score=62.16 TRINITY_DN12768_c0_g1_i1:46-1176(-)
MAYQGANQGRPEVRDLMKKTLLCKFNLSGRCLRGSSCDFAHDPQELHPAPDLRKTRLCTPFLAVGSCKYGLSCTFAHTAEELRTVENGVQERGEVRLFQGSMTSATAQPACSLFDTAKGPSSEKHAKSKLAARTLLCKFYLNGACTRGSACSFAHGEDKLRQKPDLFKTGLCLRFMTSGECRHDQGCRFAHGMQELRSREDGQDFETAKEKMAHEAVEHAHVAKGAGQKILEPSLEANLSKEDSEHVYLSVCVQATRRKLSNKPIAPSKTALPSELACEDTDLQQYAADFSRKTTATGPASMASLPLLEEERDHAEFPTSSAPTINSPSRIAMPPWAGVTVKNTFVHIERDEEDGCRVRSTSSPAALSRTPRHQRA